MSSDETANPSSNQTGAHEETHVDAEDVCKIRSAAEAVRRAKAELKKAKDLYAQVRRQAADRLDAVRKTTVGDVVDGTLNTVRKRPGMSLFAATLAGFLLGRLFRR